MSEIKLQKMYTFPQEVLWGFEVLHHIDIPQVIKKLTSLNMAKNPAPVNLFCSINRLTSLDLTGNTALTTFYCNHNQFTKEGLEVLFGTLNDITGTKAIYIKGNSGTTTCNQTITTAKGWTVED